MQRLLLRISLGIFILFGLGMLVLHLFKESDSLTPPSSEERVSIVATMYPLAYFASGLDPSADITTIVGAGVEPHDFEPSIADVRIMEDADLLLVNRGVDEWAVDAITDRSGPTVDVMELLNLPIFDNAHVWLNPLYAQQIVLAIGDQLTYLHPGNAEVIQRNVLQKISDLIDVDEAYRSRLSDCSVPIIVTSHSAFDVLADRYGFTAYSITGANPESEPSAAALAELVDLVQLEGITTVFAESRTSDALARTVAEESGARLDVLDPLESLSSSLSEETGYTEVMLNNLEKLSTAMVCQK